jgi:hypothetical protein
MKNVRRPMITAGVPGHREPQVGHIRCGRLTVSYQDEVIGELGAASPPNMWAMVFAESWCRRDQGEGAG